MRNTEWKSEDLEKSLPKRFKQRQFWISFLNRFARCSTYWYIPKARALSKTSIVAAKRILQTVFDHFLDREWNTHTELQLHSDLLNRGVIKPSADPSSALPADIAALVRIYKKWLEILGLAYIESKYWTITDAGLDVMTAKRPERVIMNQINRFQFPDGIRGKEGQWGGITPLPFLIELLRRYDYIDREEWILFVNLAQRNEHMADISQFISEWRRLEEKDRGRIIRSVQRIPYAIEQEKDVFGIDVLFDHSGSRYNKIKLNTSYQLAFFGFPVYLSVSREKITFDSKVKSYNYPDYNSITPIKFRDYNDWVYYFGDPLKKPDWIEAIKYRMTSAGSKMEAKEILEKAKRKLKIKPAKEESEAIERAYIEKIIEEFYKDNLSLIESGLQLHSETDDKNDSILGQQYSTSIGRMDLLCRSKNGDFVVIEVKRDYADDEAVGQLLRYMGWIYRHKGTNVRGVLLAGGFTDKTKYARIGVIKGGDPNYIKLLKYQIKPEEVI